MVIGSRLGLRSLWDQWNEKNCFLGVSGIALPHFPQRASSSNDLPLSPDMIQESMVVVGGHLVAMKLSLREDEAGTMANRKEMDVMTLLSGWIRPTLPYIKTFIIHAYILFIVKTTLSWIFYYSHLKASQIIETLAAESGGIVSNTLKYGVGWDGMKGTAGIPLG